MLTATGTLVKKFERCVTSILFKAHKPCKMTTVYHGYDLDRSQSFEDCSGVTPIIRNHICMKSSYSRKRGASPSKGHYIFFQDCNRIVGQNATPRAPWGSATLNKGEVEPPAIYSPSRLNGHLSLFAAEGLSSGLYSPQIENLKSRGLLSPCMTRIRLGVIFWIWLVALALRISRRLHGIRDHLSKGEGKENSR